MQIYGPESSGKTTLAMAAVAEVHRVGGQAMLFDAEHAYNAEYCKVRSPLHLCLPLPALTPEQPS